VWANPSDVRRKPQLKSSVRSTGREEKKNSPAEEKEEGRRGIWITRTRSDALQEDVFFLEKEAVSGLMGGREKTGGSVAFVI